MTPFDPEHDDDIEECDLERFLYEVNRDRPEEPDYSEAELDEMHARFAALFS